MKTDLAIIGQGAVTPTGVGIEALFGRAPVETPTSFLSRPEEQYPVYRVDLKDPALQRWQNEPRLRRASPISYFLVEAASQALAEIDDAARAQTGLIVAYSTGCLDYTRRLFQNVVTNGQKTASPALFPETVFNSPVSHVAATLRLEGAAYALIGDDTAWIAALKTAWLWLEQARVQQVLVLGVEEFDAATLDAYRSARWLNRKGGEGPYVPAEGAAGVLIRKAQTGDTLRISQMEEGFIHRTRAQARAAGERCLREFDSTLPAFRSAGRNWLGPIESDLLAERPALVSKVAPYLGEASTASAAWNTLRALGELNPKTPRLLVPIWGTDHQIGALQLEKQIAPAD